MTTTTNLLHLSVLPPQTLSPPPSSLLSPSQSPITSDLILLDVTGMLCGACVLRVKSILTSDLRVDSAVVNMLTETAAIKLKSVDEVGDVAEEMARKINAGVKIKDVEMEAEVVRVERRGRGRPKKIKVVEVEAEVERRGRKRKIQDVETVVGEGVKREMRSKALVGSYVNKEFEGSYYLGKVVSYDRGLYRVEYEDGDSEDFDSGELRPFLIENDSCDDRLVLRKKELDELILKKYEKEKAEKMRVDASVGVEGSSLAEVIDHGTDGAVPNVDCPSDSNEYGLDGDLCIEAEACIVPPPELPPSTGNIGVSDECVADLLSVYSFLRSFSVSLFLSPFGLEDFVGSTRGFFMNVTYQNLYEATAGFSSTNLIGSGSFGSMYKGVLDPDGTDVAVKVLHLYQRGAMKSFIADCRV